MLLLKETPALLALTFHPYAIVSNQLRNVHVVRINENFICYVRANYDSLSLTFTSLDQVSLFYYQSFDITMQLERMAPRDTVLRRFHMQCHVNTFISGYGEAVQRHAQMSDIGT